MTRNTVAKAIKLRRILGQSSYAAALACYGVAAGVEHEPVLRRLGDVRSVVDIGANRGQFALAARQWAPAAKIIAFEPLREAAAKFQELFQEDSNVRLHQAAIGPQAGQGTIHISRCDDSSSLLAVTPLQEDLFPGTGEVATQMVQVGPLEQFVQSEEILAPALLKLDVQGYELQALYGCEQLLDRFSYIYVECSFVELYQGQALADEIIAHLTKRGFHLTGVYNMQYDRQGRAIQGDFLFCRADPGQSP